MRKAVFVAEKVGNRKTIFLPSPVEERDHPMVKDIEEVEQGAVLRAQALEDELTVTIRKDALRPAQTHKINGHSRGARLGPLELLNLASRKRQGAVHGKAHSFVVGIRESPNRRSIPPQALEQGDSLEE